MKIWDSPHPLILVVPQLLPVSLRHNLPENLPRGWSTLDLDDLRSRVNERSGRMALTDKETAEYGPAAFRRGALETGNFDRDGLGSAAPLACVEPSTPRRRAVLPPDERADDRQVREIEHDASSERRSIKADGVVNRASKPPSKRHS
jgi:hypothetical protein